MADTKIITPYDMPDLDGYACAVAYAELLSSRGEDARPAIFGDIQAEIKFVLKRFGIPPVDEYQGSLDLPIILVDASDRNGLFKMIVPERVIKIIDHRKDNEIAAFPNAQAQIELVGAAATLIAEKFMAAKVEISKASATLLYSAIISNTLNFQAKVTTERDKAAASWLNQFLKLPPDYAWEMFEDKSDFSGQILETTMENTLGFYIFNGKKILIVQLEMVGAEAMAEQRKNEINQIMKKLVSERQLDGYIMTISELKECFNIYITDDEAMKSALEAVLGVSFENSVAKRPGLMMRKELVPLLKEYFEGQS